MPLSHNDELPVVTHHEICESNIDFQLFILQTTIRDLFPQEDKFFFWVSKERLRTAVVALKELTKCFRECQKDHDGELKKLQKSVEEQKGVLLELGKQLQEWKKYYPLPDGK